MAAELNHTIVWCTDQEKSAAFLADILGRPTPKHFAHFTVVEFDNGVSLDFSGERGEIPAQHYAFLVGEKEFDDAFARIKARNITYWADPARTKENQINRHDGGRGLYWLDPDGHVLEIITRRYGSGA
jgi:catechol 2,3-dioxygenase-like lactoylglutathione lyase family enzyme